MARLVVLDEHDRNMAQPENLFFQSSVLVIGDGMKFPLGRLVGHDNRQNSQHFVG